MHSADSHKKDSQKGFRTSFFGNSKNKCLISIKRGDAMQFRETPAQASSFGHESQAEYLKKSSKQVTALTVYMSLKKDNLLLSLITLKTVKPVTCWLDRSAVYSVSPDGAEQLCTWLCSMQQLLTSELSFVSCRRRTYCMFGRGQSRYVARLMLQKSVT